MHEHEQHRVCRTRTQGVKGAKMPRINMAFDRDLYEYIREKSLETGSTMTRIVNDAIRRQKESGQE